MSNYISIANALKEKNVTLVAVSKTKPNSAIQAMYDLGQRIFGENRVQELSQKYEDLPKDIQWHLIGHLQTNKVKYIAPFVQMIHSVESLRLLDEINKQARKNNRIIDCLLQMRVAKEETKFGMTLQMARELLEDKAYPSFENIRIAGVMGMATFTDDKAQIQQEFSQLKSMFDTLKENYFPNSTIFKEISMGMSDDYQIAIEEGSIMVRIGSLLFAE
jgi:PLP dependent protein